MTGRCQCPWEFKHPPVLLKTRQTAKNSTATLQLGSVSHSSYWLLNNISRWVSLFKQLFNFWWQEKKMKTTKLKSWTRGLKKDTTDSRQWDNSILTKLAYGPEATRGICLGLLEGPQNTSPILSLMPHAQETLHFYSLRPDPTAARSNPSPPHPAQCCPN